MSRTLNGSLGGVLVAATLAISTAAPLHGQADFDVEALSSQISRLIVERDRAIAHARRLDEAEKQAGLDHVAMIDSVRVGPFWVIAREEQVTALARIAGEAWASYAPFISGDEMEGFRMTLEYQGAQRAAALVAGDGGTFVGRWDSRALQVRSVAKVISGRLDRDLNLVWWWGSSLGLHSDHGKLMTSAYRSLVTSQTQSIVVRGCLQDGGDDCWRALGFVGAEEWWRNWYTPEELRELLVWEFVPPPHLQLLFDRCVVEELDACDALVQRHWTALAPSPLSSDAGHSLWVHAIRLGGAGSLTRLKAGVASARLHRTSGLFEPQIAIDILAEVAGVTPDELIADWRENVLLARPRPQAATMLTTLQTGLWVLLIFGFSLRSTRWRHA